MVGVISRGIKCPIIREGDNLVKIVVDNVLKASKDDNFEIQNQDVIGITESVVARAQGNYATVEQIAADVKRKTGGGTIGVIFPILSRNRFAVCLKGIASAADKVVLMLSYPCDEVGNCIIDRTDYFDYGLLTLDQFNGTFESYTHPWTKINYIEYYNDIITSVGAECEIIFSNNPIDIFRYTTTVIVSSIHNRFEIIEKLKRKCNSKFIYGLHDILAEPVEGSGYNKEYGLLGSNKVDENKIKLFPRTEESFALVNKIKKEIFNKTGKNVFVMVYGDGAFKDPTCQIWELADPVVSPAFTKGLEGSPNELKLKYLADNQFAKLNGQELDNAIINAIKKKDKNLSGNMLAEGTTPRKYVDLLGSLCDLTSGSGDKGTPIVLIQNYFKNYAN